jgi:acetyl esterase/lipase
MHGLLRAGAAAIAGLALVPAGAGARKLVIDQPSVVPWPAPAPVPWLTIKPKQRPRGIVIVFHGGGWASLDPGIVRPEMRPYARAGFLALAPNYRGYLPSLVDAIHVTDNIRARYGRALPICVVGGSAGANLALLVAEQLPYVACALGQAPITDLMTIAGAPSTTDAGNVLRVALAGLTRYHLDDYSPARHAELLGRRPVRLVAATTDRTAPYSQAVEMQRSAPRSVRLITLHHGRDPVYWIHSDVSARELRRSDRSDVRWVEKQMAAARR